MKKLIKNLGLAIATLFISSHTVMGQTTQTCEKIVLQIYDGINQKKARHLLPYLSDGFSMAGQTGEIAKLIFPEYISKLNTTVSNIKLISKTNTKVLTLVYEAKFADMGVMKSTFIFDKDNKLVNMDLLPTMVQQK